VKVVDSELQIVCGAPNARVGIKVILARVGAVIPNGKFQIKASEIRGIKSEGMLCSASELMIGSDQAGIVELPEYALVGEGFEKYYGLDDPVIEISVTPNRGDCLGVYYIARELSVRGIGEIVQHQYANDALERDIKSSEIKGSCLGLMRISNIKNCTSPEWLKLLLQSVGINPISAVVDITNYMCHSFARPMHVYDYDQLNGALQIDFAKEGYKFQALNDKSYELSAEDLVVRDDVQPRAIAGVIGDMSSACSMSTKNVILESAIFPASLVALSSRKHKIETESKQRFERGVDHEFMIPALQIAADMIVEICGGEVSEITLSGNMPTKKTLSFDISSISDVIGVDINKDRIISILSRLGFKILEDHGNILTIEIPSFRHDISISEDIVEEVARIEGLSKIPATKFDDQMISRVLTTKQRRSFDVRRMLASVGYDEVVTWSFMDENKAKYFAEISEKMRLIHPISSDLGYMRPSIVPNLLESISKNLSRSFDSIAIFEVGPIFGESREDLYVSGAITGLANEKTTHEQARVVDVFDVKRDLELILKEMGVRLDKCNLGPAPLYYHPYRSSSFGLGKNIIGYFGEIHPHVLELYDISKRVIVFEVNLDSLPESKLKFGARDAYKPSDYQIVKRDFAFLMDADREVGSIANYIQSIDKNIIKRVHLFDIYSGDGVEIGKKSVAINILFQADDRTMTEEEINNLSDKVVKGVQDKYLCTLRS
jgi:phenylalanyl-tRNA synthetase beta chain